MGFVEVVVTTLTFYLASLITLNTSLAVPITLPSVWMDLSLVVQMHLIPAVRINLSPAVRLNLSSAVQINNSSDASTDEDESIVAADMAQE